MVAHIRCIPSECFELRPVGTEPINIFLSLDSQLALLTFASQADCAHLPGLAHIINEYGLFSLVTPSLIARAWVVFQVLVSATCTALLHSKSVLIQFIYIFHILIFYSSYPNGLGQPCSSSHTLDSSASFTRLASSLSATATMPSSPT